jgi:hypothetical protein
MAYQVRPRPDSYQRSKPVRNERYLAFIRRQPSVVSELGPCDACHTGPHGYGQKANDLDCIPLTRKEHSQFDADPQAFAAANGLEIPTLIEGFQASYIQACLEREGFRC